MDFAFSEEQEQFREVVARFAAERWPIAESRRWAEAGPGAPDAGGPLWKAWRQMAQELGLDPFDVRRANLLRIPALTPNGLRVESCGLGECLDRVEAASGWDSFEPSRYSAFALRPRRQDSM